MSWDGTGPSQWVEYHSAVWRLLVETGWRTAEVEPGPGGVQFARMVPR